MHTTSLGFQEPTVFFLSHLCPDLLLISFWLLVIFEREATSLLLDDVRHRSDRAELSQQTTPFCIGPFLSLWYQALTQHLPAVWVHPELAEKCGAREDGCIWCDDLEVTGLSWMRTGICRAACPVLVSDPLTHRQPAQCLSHSCPFFHTDTFRGSQGVLPQASAEARGHWIRPSNYGTHFEGLYLILMIWCAGELK